MNNTQIDDGKVVEIRKHDAETIKRRDQLKKLFNDIISFNSRAYLLLTAIVGNELTIAERCSTEEIDRLFYMLTEMNEWQHALCVSMADILPRDMLLENVVNDILSKTIDEFAAHGKLYLDETQFHTGE